MSHPNRQRVQKQAQLLPTKDTLTALKSDVTLESACLELCDNSLDAWARTSDRQDSATIQINVEEKRDRTELVILDNTGGVPRDQASMLFGLGRTAKAEAERSIGTFGVGAKKSLVNLGVPFQISSRTSDEQTGWTYRISEEWFEQEQKWTVPIYDEENLSPGTTEIRIEDLNYEWSEKIADQLRTQLGRAYNLFLSNEFQQLQRTDYDLTIIVDGEIVEPEGFPSWSYTPFDGLCPRRYENIQITSPDQDKPVNLNITVGLLTKKDTTIAGTDIYCQERKIASGLRNNTGGFGGGTNRLGVFSPRHERLKVIIELETDGDGQQLPWDTQKSSINRHNPIMEGTKATRGVYNWFRRTVQQYFDADADQVPRAYLEPYRAGHNQAANEGEPLRHDFSDRERIISDCRPNPDLPQITNHQQRIEAQAILGVKSTDDILDSQIPAYELQLATETNGNTKDLTCVESGIPKSAYKEPHIELGQINKLARIHFENGIRCSDHLEQWQKPTYEEFFAKRIDSDIPPKSSIPSGLPKDTDEISTSENQPEMSEDTDLRLYSSQTISENNTDSENAELFLVFGNQSEDERGAKILDLPRHDLCDQFNLETNVGDDVIWEHLRHYLKREIGP